jgi:hypothetical protein
LVSSVVCAVLRRLQEATIVNSSRNETQNELAVAENLVVNL